MKFITAILPAFLASQALASPTKVEKRSTTICGQWDSVATGSYTVYQDLWDESAATSGSQCTTVKSLSSSTLAWSTSWSWAGGSSSVKSYANAVLTMADTQLSAITTLPTTWKWRSAPQAIYLLKDLH